MASSKLYDKVYGCLLGGLIGDAMGAPVEGWDYTRIIELHGEVNDFEGNGTDDSVIKGALCAALIENDGHITADEFAKALLSDPECYKLGYIPVKNMLHKLMDKLVLPVDAGYGNMQSSSSAMAISPMGIVNACNPRQASLETYDVAGLIHSGPTNFCRDGACALAAAVAEAFSPDATVQSVLNASTAYLHKESAVTMSAVIGEILTRAREIGDYQEFRRWFYDSSYKRIVICDSRETVPLALSIFYLSDGDPVKSIILAANFGRDADTLATMAGSLAGAFKGVKALKPEWVAKIELAGSAQAELASKLVQVIKMRVQQSLHSIERLNSL
jgi:ADP-ribosylglycohydrolase